MLNIHTKSREGLYEAKAIYEEGNVVVLKGSKINNIASEGFKPSTLVKQLREDSDIVNENGILLKDVKFNSLSTAACFVTGRSANGMITWKTEDGKYVRYTLKG